MDEVRYARTPDGIQIAFRVLPGGAGEPLVYLPGLVHSIESIFEDAPYARFIDGLTELGPVILIERQAIAASDPLDPTRDFYEQWVTNVIAVLDELGIERAPLVGYCVSATRRSWRAMTRRRQMPGSSPPRAGLRSRPSPSGSVGPGGSPQARARRRKLWDRVLRVTDLEARARDIQARVLVITRRGLAEATGISLETLQEFVDDIANGTAVVLEGGDLIPNAGDIDGLLFEIAEFLHGGTHTASASRPVTTILFTDLVGSTTAARELGDADWRAVLDHHDHLIERTVRRHGGTIVKTTGDGALTTFDAPLRALTRPVVCARTA